MMKLSLIIFAMVCVLGWGFRCLPQRSPSHRTTELKAKKSKQFGNKIPGMAGAASAKQAELLAKVNQNKKSPAPDTEGQTKDNDGVTVNRDWRGDGASQSTNEGQGQEYGQFATMLESMGDFTHSTDSYVEALEDARGAGLGEATLAEGDLAPLDVWAALTTADGGGARFRNFVEGDQLVVVVADARKDCADMKAALIELNARFPKQAATLVAVTADLAHENRKLAKKAKLTFPLLSDPDKAWLKAYGVQNDRLLEKQIFILEPNMGKVLAILKNIDSAAICEVAKTGLQVAHKRNQAL
uniref:Alkyl hydroperoxide reductase subunit C/ Thiol specific antioxidant domain-containing protein n=1 Tax=Heterosigma akashiwo TaxID=2829 RepID=A0A7S3XLL3_HETAK